MINCFHEACIVVSRGVVSWGNFLGFVDAGRSGMARRVSREVRREVSGPERKKKEIPHKRAFKGHRVHSGYTVLPLNPKCEGVEIN